MSAILARADSNPGAIVATLKSRKGSVANVALVGQVRRSIADITYSDYRS